ncbi:hypothetical protein Ferp_2380 [Ferroglobus placidus DSM 10642]|uniref:Uncharacterized protein n=1 Tax=Ferroglobus placidus (strain DSM 10642 / AEDII12DO) TaxID=589924 RepID=D3S1N2_FERPA|nr:hypothetical protein [Ferroglobus placidus]ADC66496.1 hypothetical protein Ferp_2380 [Ferroglobus placidus DSM 10642]
MNRQLFVWNAIDVDTKECLFIWLSGEEMQWKSLFSAEEKNKEFLRSSFNSSFDYIQSWLKSFVELHNMG